MRKLIVNECVETNIKYNRVKEASTLPINLAFFKTKENTYAIDSNSQYLIKGYIYRKFNLPSNAPAFNKLGLCVNSYISISDKVSLSNCKKKTIDKDNVGRTEIYNKATGKRVGYMLYDSMAVTMIKTDRTMSESFAAFVNLSGKIAFVSGRIEDYDN